MYNGLKNDTIIDEIKKNQKTMYDIFINSNSYRNKLHINLSLITGCAKRIYSNKDKRKKKFFIDFYEIIFTHNQNNIDILYPILFYVDNLYKLSKNKSVKNIITQENQKLFSRSSFYGDVPMACHIMNENLKRYMQLIVKEENICHELISL